jgi:hypothetical protein
MPWEVSPHVRELWQAAEKGLFEYMHLGCFCGMQSRGKSGDEQLRLLAVLDDLS